VEPAESAWSRHVTRAASQPETRAKRIEHFVAMLARHEKIRDRPRRVPKA
jgi:uncharacterized protein YdeI (YjbR/CyaY-like superfamily)